MTAPGTATDDAHAIVTTLRDALTPITGQALKQLARKAEMHEGVVYNVRAGKITPRLDTTCKLLRALGYTLTITKAG